MPSLPMMSPWWKRANSGVSNSASLISPTYPMTCAAKPSRGYRRCCTWTTSSSGNVSGVLVRIDEGQLAGRQLFLDRDGLVLRSAARLKAAHARHQAVVVQIQALGDRPQVFHLQVFARQIQAEGGMIVDDHAAIAIQNLAARRQHRNRLDAVLERPLLINLGIANLQVPEAGDQEQKDGDGDVLKECDLLRGELRIVAQKLVGGALIVFAVDVKFHNIQLFSCATFSLSKRRNNGRATAAFNSPKIRVCCASKPIASPSSARDSTQ